MLASAIVTPVRQALSDEFAPYRHSDTELFAHIGRAVAELYSLHPEGFMRTQYVREAPAAPTTLTTDLDIDGYWTNALVHHVASKVLGQDSESEGNRALAVEHWKHWLEEI